jgi:hypothetical protein
MSIETFVALLNDFAQGNLAEREADCLIRAVHEAGHAVVATHFNFSFRYADIITVDNRLGSFDLIESELSNPGRIAEYVQVLLAGIAAHDCLMPSLGADWIQEGGKLDYESIDQMLQKLTPDDLSMILDGMSLEDYLRLLRTATRNLLREPIVGQAFFVTADELMKESTISCERVKQIYAETAREICPPQQTL